MFHINKIAKNEQGAVCVIVAFAMTTLLCFAALVVDRGGNLSQKRTMQNAADSAALACAYKLSENSSLSDSDLKTIAKTYIKDNDDNENAEITFSKTAKDVTVKIHENGTPYLFSKAADINVTSTAQLSKTVSTVDLDGECLISEGSGLTMALNGTNTTVTGNMHSNGNIIAGTNLTISGIASAVGTITCNDSTQTVPNKQEKVSAMYESTKIDIAQLKGNSIKITNKIINQFNSDEYNSGNYSGEIHIYNYGTYRMTFKTFNALVEYLDADTTLYFDNAVAFDGQGGAMHGGLIADGDISFNGWGMSMSSDMGDICFVSTTGNINYNGGMSGSTGIVLAPKGKVSINGSNFHLEGCIIAKQIEINGSYHEFIYNEDAFHWLPSEHTQVKLVK